MVEPPDPAWRNMARAMVPTAIRAAYWWLRSARARQRILSGRHYEPALCRAIQQRVRPGAICVDVGANTGLITALMAHHVGPTGTVYAFEACPDNERRFTATLRTCRLQDRARFIGAAVNDGAADSLQLYRGRGNSHSEWNIVGRDADGRPTAPAYTVPATSLDAWFPATAHIDLVKIDVEGAESQVLAGMRGILNRCRPVLVIECHCADNWRACAELTADGYVLRNLDGAALDPQADYPATHLVAVHEAPIASAA